MNNLLYIFLFLSIIGVTMQSACVRTGWEKVEQKGQIPRGRWDGSSAFNRKLGIFYRYGGLNGVSPNDYPVNDFYEFDTKTLIWTNSTSETTPFGRAEAVLFVDEKTGYVYLSGGRYRFKSGQNIEYNNTYFYNPSTKVWKEVVQTIAQQSIANRSTEAIVVGKEAYVVAGTTSTLPSFINLEGAARNDVAKFTSKKGWEKVTTKGGQNFTARGHHHLGYDKDKNMIYVVGGYTADPLKKSVFSERNYLDDVWQLDLDTNKWNEIAIMNEGPGKRDNVKIIHANKRYLYILGGSTYTNQNFIDVWKLDLKYGLWEEITVDDNGVYPPTPIGAYYFTREIENGCEFWMSSGSSSEIAGVLIEDFYKLTLAL